MLFQNTFKIPTNRTLFDIKSRVIYRINKKVTPIFRQQSIEYSNVEVITRETKHYAAGSTKPEKPDAILRVYSMKFCPFAERARLVLLAKKLRHEIVNINLNKKPEWFLELNSQGKVPTLDTGKEIVTESVGVCDYLDEKYPEPKLYPTDADAKQRHKELIKQFDKVIGAYYKTLTDKATPLTEHAANLVELLQEYEDELKDDFFGGKQPGVLDYVVWPFAERAEVIDLARGEKFPLPAGKLPKIVAWCGRMRKLDIIKNTMFPTEQSYKFMQAFIAGGDIDYDSI